MRREQQPAGLNIDVVIERGVTQHAANLAAPGVRRRT